MQAMKLTENGLFKCVKSYNLVSVNQQMQYNFKAKSAFGFYVMVAYNIFSALKLAHCAGWHLLTVFFFFKTNIQLNVQNYVRKRAC